MMYLGDFTEDYNNLIFYWNTNDANGASVTRSTDGTLKLIRSDGTDCTAGSLTDTEDSPDTGIHKCAVDLSVNDKCIAGYDYVVWVDGTVIATQTVNAALAQFSIENRFNPVEAIAGSGSNPLNLQDVINDVNSQTVLSESNIRGTDDDTLKTLSDQIDGISAGSGATIDQINESLTEVQSTIMGSASNPVSIQDAIDQTVLSETEIRGIDDDTLKILSDQIDGISAGSGATIDQINESLTEVQSTIMGSASNPVSIQDAIDQTVLSETILNDIINTSEANIRGTDSNNNSNIQDVIDQLIVTNSNIDSTETAIDSAITTSQGVIITAITVSEAATEVDIITSEGIITNAITSTETTLTNNINNSENDLTNLINDLEVNITGSASNPINLQNVIDQVTLSETEIRGTDDDTLKTLSGQIDTISAGTGATISQVNASLEITEANIRGGDSNINPNLLDIINKINITETDIRGSDDDTLKTVSDQIDGISTSGIPKLGD